MNDADARNTTGDSLRNHFLLAMPSLTDAIFANSVTYLCEHNEHGAMGIVINQPLDLSVEEVLEHLNLSAAGRLKQMPVMAVGTTVVRTLEGAAEEDGLIRACAGATDLFIQPPFRFRVIDGLLTNFHLPQSTLLALVMALAGVENVRSAYAQAVEHRYRFFSYGDAMLVPPVIKT